MSKVKIWFPLLLAFGLIVTGAIEISANSDADKPDCAIRKVEQQVVLYTIYRGSYGETGKVVGRLFALAGQKAITPRGPVSYAYLNNPRQVSSEHWLTEIRIPVAKDALKLAGTLGEMTDVKALSAMEVAVTTKPEGLADPGPVYNHLYTWIVEQGYRATDNACETFLNSGMAGDYAQMKSEIMIPVEKFPER
jgi:effector-binding domain-containing protein